MTFLWWYCSLAAMPPCSPALSASPTSDVQCASGSARYLISLLPAHINISSPYQPIFATRTCGSRTSVGTRCLCGWWWSMARMTVTCDAAANAWSITGSETVAILCWQGAYLTWFTTMMATMDLSMFSLVGGDVNWCHQHNSWYNTAWYWMFYWIVYPCLSL